MRRILTFKKIKIPLYIKRVHVVCTKPYLSGRPITAYPEEDKKVTEDGLDLSTLPTRWGDGKPFYGLDVDSVIFYLTLDKCQLINISYALMEKKRLISTFQYTGKIIYENTAYGHISGYNHPSGGVGSDMVYAFRPYNRITLPKDVGFTACDALFYTLLDESLIMSDSPVFQRLFKDFEAC